MKKSRITITLNKETLEALKLVALVAGKKISPLVEQILKDSLKDIIERKSA